MPLNIHIDGSMSSQFLTGLLFAYSAAGASDTTITVHDLKSRPYIDMTLDVLKHFKMKVPVNDHYQSFYYDSKIGLPETSDIYYEVESDWSGAAFLLVAAAIAGPLLIRGLNLSSMQADRKIIDALMQANAGIAFEAKGIRVHPSKMKAIQFDATDCPDLFPPLVALADFCEGTSNIKGVSRLKHKESDRGNTLQSEFEKLGVKVDIKDDIMSVQGNDNVQGGEVQSHDDHRIAMALAVAGLKARNASFIHNAQAVRKSYPAFFEDLKKAGATLSLFHIPAHE
jgi:3-phosphoshikimate 1-carboxyvinyltransferase